MVEYDDMNYDIDHDVLIRELNEKLLEIKEKVNLLTDEQFEDCINLVVKMQGLEGSQADLLKKSLRTWRNRNGQFIKS